MKPKKYADEPWLVGITASGITGPTCPSISGATVSESVDRYRWSKGVEDWVADGSKGTSPEMKIEHPSILITQGMRVIAIIPTGEGDGEENAQLIVAAPRVLKALKDLLSVCEHERKTGLCQGSEWAQNIENARTAIAETEVDDV